MVLCIKLDARKWISPTLYHPTHPYTHPNKHPRNAYVYHNTCQLSSQRTYREDGISSLCRIERHNLHYFERLWNPSFVTTLKYNLQHRVILYYVPSSSIVLCTLIFARLHYYNCRINTTITITCVVGWFWSFKELIKS